MQLEGDVAPKILGAVIAGGRSRRFGSDKAMAKLEGCSLLGHVIAGLSTQCDSVVVCGREATGFTCLKDRPAPDMGPLGGLAGVLHYAANNRFAGVLTSACDTPEVPPDLASLLCGAAPAVLRGHPLFGWWPASHSAELDAYLASGMSLRVTDWATQSRARQVSVPCDLPNINRPADLTALQKRRLLAA